MAMSPGEMMAARAEQQSQPPMPPQGMDGAQGPQGPAPEASAPESNPILEALRNIALYVAKKTEAGDPKSAEMQALLAQFVQLIQSDAQGATPPPEMEGSPMAPPPPQGPKSMQDGGQGGVDPMMGNMGGKRMSNQVPVI